MIIVSGGIKGGTGKTTVATNLAIIRANAGRDVLLIDADSPQFTATGFTQLRNDTQEGAARYTSIQLTGKSVRNETQRLSSKYDDIIIDVGGRDSTSQRAALTIADVFLVPFMPRSFDVWTIKEDSELVSEVRPVNPKLKAYTFLSKADPRGHDNEDSAEVLREAEELQFIDTPLVFRKAFGNAAGQGLSVVELKPEDPKASEEIMTLYSLIFDNKTESF